MRVVWLWLGLPLLGLAELVGHVCVGDSAPTPDDWAHLGPAVKELRRGDELVLVAPSWGEPLARHALGDDFFPLEHVARADDSTFLAAIEIGFLGQRSPELSTWPEQQARRVGPFVLRRVENPAPAVVRFDFVGQLLPGHVEVAGGEGRARQSCPWRRLGAQAGGLHGHSAFPSERFVCGRPLHEFVGVTVVEDEHYRPHRCIWAHPPDTGARYLRYPSVPLGAVIRGYGTLPWFLMRDGAGTPIEMTIRVDGDPIGTFVHQDQQGWHRFEFALGKHAHQTATVEFEVRSARPARRHFCFQADTR